MSDKLCKHCETPLLLTQAGEQGRIEYSCINNDCTHFDRVVLSIPYRYGHFRGEE